MDHLQEVANGNESAFEYLVYMSKVFRVWDDLYDKDKEVPSEDVDEVFRILTFQMSQNLFFKENRDALESFIFVAWNAWMDANRSLKSDNRMLKMAGWFIRNYCVEIDVLVAFKVGGIEHVKRVRDKCRTFYLKELSQGGPDGFL